MTTSATAPKPPSTAGPCPTPDAALLTRYASTIPGAGDVRGEVQVDATVNVNDLPTTRTGKDFYREFAPSIASVAYPTLPRPRSCL